MMNTPTDNHSFNNKHNYNSLTSQSTISIASHNVISFTDYTKRLQIIHESLYNNIDILGLSETNLTSKQSKFVKKEILSNYNSYFSSSPNKCKGTGVVILLKPTLNAHVIHSKGIKGRYIYADLAFRKRITIRLFQVYLHANRKDINERIAIQKEILQEIVNAKSRGYEVIIMGDLNIDYHVTNRQRANYVSRIDFIRALQGFNLIDINASIKDDSTSNFTWQRNSYTAVLDYIWISQQLLQYFVYKKRSFPNLYKSDHMIMTLMLDGTKLLKQPSVAYNRNHDMKRKIYLYKEMTSEAWDNFSNMLYSLILNDQILNKVHSASDISSKNHLNCLWSHWRDLVIKAADRHIPYVMATTGKNDFVPKNLQHIQKSIKSLNTILKRFKKCFIEQHDCLNNWPLTTRQDIISIMESMKIEDQHWHDVILHSSSVSQLHRTIKKILDLLLTRHQIEHKSATDKRIKSFIQEGAQIIQRIQKK